MGKLKLKKSVKKKLKIIVAVLGCVIICVGGVSFCKLVFQNNQRNEQKDIKETVNQDGSIDFLAVGNSDLFSGFNPLQLYHETGITSYSAGASMMNMSLTYYMLDEIFTYQKPKVLLLELDSFFETRGIDDEKEARETAVERNFSLFRYTEKWNEIRNKDYTKNLKKNSRDLLRGYYYKTEQKGNFTGYTYMGKSSEKEPMVEYTKKYFSKIMKLAKDNNCQIFFVCFPSKTSWTAKKHNTVEATAKKYNVPYLDFNVNQYGTGFDWETDTRDAGNHMNHLGATKLTKFIGEYLSEHFHLTDHRGDAHFKDWEHDYRYFMDNL